MCYTNVTNFNISNVVYSWLDLIWLSVENDFATIINLWLFDVSQQVKAVEESHTCFQHVLFVCLRFGILSVMWLSLGLNLASLILLGIVPNLFGICVGRILAGIAVTATTTHMPQYLADIAEVSVFVVAVLCLYLCYILVVIWTVWLARICSIRRHAPRNNHVYLVKH